MGEGIGFTENDKEGTIQPHDDALIVTLQIGGFDVRRVMIDKRSRAKVMYPFTPGDLTRYDTPLVAFDGTIRRVVLFYRQCFNGS